MVSQERATNGLRHGCAIVNIVLDGTASTYSHVFSRVPQGTVLEPLMFHMISKTTIKLFTDDALLYKTNNDASAEIQLQHDRVV